MGVARAGNLETVGQSNAQFSGGSLRFDGSKSQYLNRTPGSAGNRQTWTWSGWVKRNSFGVNNNIFSGVQDGNNGTVFYFDTSNCLNFFNYVSGSYAGRRITTNVYRDSSSWYHILLVWDSTNATVSNRIRIYVNGVEVTTFSTNTDPSSTNSIINSTNSNQIGADVGFNNGYSSLQISNAYFIDGQALTPSSFGYTDPLTNTWRPKKYTGTFTGTNTFYLPFDGSAPIGQDQSGNGNNWTPVNFGGSNTLEKATGALPILNTDGGGKVARVGVRTDSNASSLVLALPLVGIKSDFSNAVNSGTSNKVVTANGNAAGISTISNFYGGSFYFDGTGDYLSIPSSSDFAFGTGDFTIEFHSFFAASSLPANATFYSNNYTGTQGVLIQSSSAALYFYVASSSVYTGNVLVAQKWQHIAITRSSGTISIFVDGVLQASGTLSGSAGNSSVGVTIAAGSNGGTGFELNGYLQDIRVYKGLAKYTQNFIPASTDPDILPDTPSGVAYSSNVALVPSTDGAVAFDGVSDYLNLGSSADYNVGTGDFTFECFAYYVTKNNYSGIFGPYTYSDNGLLIQINSSNCLRLVNPNSIDANGSTNISNRWVHIAVTRSGTTLRGFIDGIQEISTTYSSSIDFANGGAAVLGVTDVSTYPGTYDFRGFISNVHFVKGTALYTSNFTPPTGPISSVANTKLLCCKSNSSATAFDVSPGTITANGNATASNFNPFTVNINTQRGQESGWCTLNPLTSPGTNYITLSNGNLDQVALTETVSSTKGTVGVTTGKWYWECNLKLLSSGGVSPRIGICRQSAPSLSQANGADEWIIYMSDYSGYGGRGAHDSTLVGSYAPFANGDVGMFALDMNSSKIYFGKNGIWLNGGNPVNGSGAFFTDVTGEIFPLTNTGYYSSVSMNFGQKPFKFPPPAGFQPLALANTPRPTIVRPDQYVGIVTYTGNGSTQSVNTGFKPDFVWVKCRTASVYHALFDSVRGTNKRLGSNETSAEQDQSPSGLSSFNSNGFTVVDGSTGGNGVNGSPGGLYAGSTAQYVAWAWKAGGNSNTYNINDIGYSTASAAGLTAGTITPSGASVNTKSGFSIVRLTTSASPGTYTVSHGLGKEVAFFITKKINGTSQWWTYHKSIGQSGYLNLASTAASATDYAWGANPTSSVITYTNDFLVGSSDYIIYAWAEIPGFSKFGSYIGNSSTDGPVIVTGFRPAWILIKQITSSGDGWYIYDTQRNKYNPTNTYLWAQGTNEDQTSGNFDILSNGFKLRTTASALNYGTTPYTYIYAAFAESPTFNLYGGQSNAR